MTDPDKPEIDDTAALPQTEPAEDQPAAEDDSGAELAEVYGDEALGAAGDDAEADEDDDDEADADDAPDVAASPRAKPQAEPAPKGGDRIAKVMARAGAASRRDAERMILEGRVTVNGRVVRSPALDVLPSDRITVDGAALDAPQETRLWVYYKPIGLVTSEADEKGRQTVFDALPRDLPRVMTVGRLDLNSEGLLLLTNDGALKRRLELPSTGWLRRYRVRVNGHPTDLTFGPLRRGAEIDGEQFQPMEVVLDSQQGANAWLTVGIREGRNREIRRAMAHVGLTVNRLIRIAYGPFRLTGMEKNEVREVKRRVLRDQLGGLLTDDAPAEGEPQRAISGPRASRYRSAPGARPPRGDSPFAGRPDRGPRPERAPRAEEGADGETRARKPRMNRADKAGRVEGGFDRGGFAPRGEGGDRGGKPYAPRGDRPYKPRVEGDARPPREGGFDRGDRAGKPYAPRGDRPYKPRAEGDARPPREGGFDRGDRAGKPYAPRGDRPYKPRTEGDARPPREGGFDRGDRAGKPYAPRGDRPYKPRAEGDARPPREGGFDRGDRAGKPYAPRGDRPYKPRAEGGDSGAGRAPRPAGAGGWSRDRGPQGAAGGGSFKPRGAAGNGSGGKPRFGSKPGPRGPAGKPPRRPGGGSSPKG